MICRIRSERLPTGRYNWYWEICDEDEFALRCEYASDQTVDLSMERALSRCEEDFPGEELGFCSQFDNEYF